MQTAVQMWIHVMTDQKTFLHDLGKRLCRLRKEQGLTQAQLGNMVDVTQQVIAEYEAGYRNIPVYRLVSLSEALGVQLDDLAKGSTGATKKRGPASKLERLTEQVSRLPRSRQQFVIEMIENAVKTG